MTSVLSFLLKLQFEDLKFSMAAARNPNKRTIRRIAGRLRVLIKSNLSLFCEITNEPEIHGTSESKDGKSILPT